MKNIFKRLLIKNKQNSQSIPTGYQKQSAPSYKFGQSHVGQSITTKDVKDSIIIQYNEEVHHYDSSLVDKKINENITLIRQSRFFAEFEAINATLVFGAKILNGELKGGSNGVKSRALAWCSRLLSLTNANKAEEYLNYAKAIGDCPEIKVADAFLYSNKGDKNSAIKMLGELDIPLSKSAALRIIANSGGYNEALKWFEAADIAANDLDSEGKCLLLTIYLQLAYYEEAKKFINVFTEDDFKEMPILYNWVALTHLIITVPNEFRNVVLQQVPFDARNFPLAEDEESVQSRRIAAHYFTLAVDYADKLNLPLAASIDNVYSIWLEIRDPEESESGRKRLESKLRDPMLSLRLVPLAIQFNFNLDLELIEREINRQTALYGGMNSDTALARLALAFTKDKPEDIADYIEQYKDELTNFIKKQYIQEIQVEMFLKAGKDNKAKDYLNKILEDGISEADEERLKRLVFDKKGTNHIEVLKGQFKKTDSLNDLILFTGELEYANEWESLCEYALLLFERTKSLNDAELLAKALTYTQKYEQLVTFIKTNPTLVAYSYNLRMFYCWALYYEGDLINARNELSKVTGKFDFNYRSLVISLGIASGDWNSLNGYINNEWIERNERTAEELIKDAQLAFYIESPHVRDLLYTAVGKGKDNPGILVTAYYLATNAGWEDDGSVFQWLNKAVELSGDKGPIQKKSLEDIVNLQPDWEHHENDIFEQLSLNKIPMFLAAESLNKTLIQTMLFPAIINQLENDPRKRSTIPAFSGKRIPMKINLGMPIALDASVLLTLDFLGILEKALDVFEKVYIPHSTIGWLFEEKQKVTYHQPSKIREANQIQHLLSTGTIERINPGKVLDSSLSSQVGKDLATLITEAKNISNEENKGYVIRPYPVHRVASLMKETADLDGYTGIMSSCEAVVKRLRAKGQITSDQEKKALTYLKIHEELWPNQPDIEDGAILFLDDLTINYFLHLGILEKLKAAGFRLIVPNRVVDEANVLISYNNTSNKIKDAIERIRSVVNFRIESGQIKVCKSIRFNEKDKHSISSHPTVGLFNINHDCEAILVDDRFLNQHSYINLGQAQANVFNTLDLLDTLVSSGTISAEEKFEYKALLRRAGYCFIPVDSEELNFHLNVTTVNNGKVIETAELKAIRENILLVQMRKYLQLPDEALWLTELIKTLIQVLGEQWRSHMDFSISRAYSDWILRLVDIRGWAHFYINTEGNTLMNLQKAFILSLLSPFDATTEVKDEYWSWLENAVLIPIKEQYPNLYLSIIEWYQRRLDDLIDNYMSEEDVN